MKAKILLIEDNAQNRYLVTFILEKYDYFVLQAEDGEQGILMANQSRPDLILLDIQLPIIDGYTVAREIRKIESLAKIPIIAITSYAMPGDKVQALEAGCTGYIEKPINPDTFLAQIEKYLEDIENGAEV